MGCSWLRVVWTPPVVRQHGQSVHPLIASISPCWSHTLLPPPLVIGNSYFWEIILMTELN